MDQKIVGADRREGDTRREGRAVIELETVGQIAWNAAIDAGLDGVVVAMMGNRKTDTAVEAEQVRRRAALHEGDIARGRLLLERVRRLHVAGQDIEAIAVEGEIHILGDDGFIDQVKLGDIADTGELAGNAQACRADFAVVKAGGHPGLLEIDIGGIKVDAATEGEAVAAFGIAPAGHAVEFPAARIVRIGGCQCRGRCQCSQYSARQNISDHRALVSDGRQPSEAMVWSYSPNVTIGRWFREACFSVSVIPELAIFRSHDAFATPA